MDPGSNLEYGRGECIVGPGKLETSFSSFQKEARETIGNVFAVPSLLRYLERSSKRSLAQSLESSNPLPSPTLG